jgi:hypothetical protein
MVGIAEEPPRQKLWLFWQFHSLSQNDLARVLLMLWDIWWERRKAIHDHQFQNPFSTLCFMNNYLEELEVFLRKSMSSDGHIRTGAEKNNEWTPSPFGFAKICVDAGLSRQGNKGAVAAICMDESGRYIGSSVVVYEGFNPASLEAIACNEAISLALDLNERRVMVSSDCLEVINNLKANALCRYATILHEIDHRKELLQDAVFSHERRDLVWDVHKLVHTTVSLPSGGHVWLIGLPDITCISMNIVNE